MLPRRAASAIIKAAKQRRHYRALVKRSAADAPKLEDLELETAPAPPKGDATALLRVRYSSLNYKDGLVLTGSRGVAKYPVVPGINLVGSVVQDAPFAPPKGSRVACVCILAESLHSLARRRLKGTCALSEGEIAA